MPETSGRNIIITGIPRSGTTLLAAMIDGMSDSVALNEPRWQFEWADKHKASTPQDFATWLTQDFDHIRRCLLQGVPIPERRMTDGTAVTNYYRPDPEKTSVGQTFSVIPFTRPGLTPGFTLAVKHNGLYLSALRQIIETGKFTVIAIIRHPVGVIASWNHVPIPLGEGKMPGALMYWDSMRELTESPLPLLQKQVRMYDLCCRRLYNLREHIHLVKYEDLVADPSLLAAIAGKPVAIPPGMIHKRDIAFYGPQAQAIAHALRQTGEFYRKFYG